MRTVTMSRERLDKQLQIICNLIAISSELIDDDCRPMVYRQKCECGRVHSIPAYELYRQLRWALDRARGVLDELEESLFPPEET